jgi:acyl-CoA thioesterase FadM
MTKFLFQLHPRWPKIVFWSLVTCAVSAMAVSVFLFTFRHMPPTLPEAGLDSLDEYVQFNAHAAGIQGWKGILGLFVAIPTMALAGASLSRLLDLTEAKRYVVIATTVAQGCAGISMRADTGMIDQLSHVNYIASISNIDCCREAFTEEIGWPMERLRDEHGIAFMMRRLEVEYFRQIKDGDLMRILGTVAEAGRSSVELCFRIMLPEQDSEMVNKPAVMSSMHLVLVSLETGKPVRIPPWLRETWERKSISPENSV